MRKKNSAYNIIGTLGAYFSALIFNFVTQACIIRMLGIEYSGINGLFTNILTMLTIAELGIGTSIIYKLYKPIAENNIEEIKSWMKFYKICYRYVALIVSIIGVILIAFVPKIVGEVSFKDNVIVLYLICLLDTILSYIMTYKRSLLYANQKNYIINIVHTGYTIFMNTTQIILLYFVRNYVVFLSVKLVFRILENIIINTYVNKKYSFINEPAKNISAKERKDIMSRIKSMFFQKVSFVINKGIDNVVISVFLGIVSVGYYTNYNILATTIVTIIYQLVSSMTASVGDLLTENNSQKSYGIYKKINMLNAFITGISMVGFCCTITPFIKLWVGDIYLLDDFIVFSFVAFIYADSIRRAITIFKEAAGICKEDQFMYVIMALINLVSSIILCKFIGVAGVILGTILSYIFLILYSYPKYIFKPLFKLGYSHYYKENLKYLVFMIFACIVAYMICRNVCFESNIIQLSVNAIIAVSVTCIVFVIMFKNSEEFKYYIQLSGNLVKKLKGRFMKK